MKKLDLMFFDAGGGHRSAANALKQVIEQQKRPWEVRLVNVQELLDPLDIFRKITNIRMEDIYNKLLARGWTLGTPQMTRVMHGIIRIYHPAQVKILIEFWKRSRPDLVVSVIPNFNRALHDSLEQSLPGTPLVTILTDLADYPPHFWMERQSQHVICGTERAANQAAAVGHPGHHVWRTSGMILNPRYYDPALHRISEEERRAQRQRLGLQPDLPTGLVLFGGQGSSAMKTIAERLSASGIPLQLILVCGHNHALLENLRGIAQKSKVPMHLEGFTKEVPSLMRISDFFIGKPGPGSISEALAMGLPVIVERNAWTLPQERYNADWILEQRAGLVLPNFKKIEEAVRTLLEPDNFRAFRDRAKALENRAVFEIPDILAKILEGPH